MNSLENARSKINEIDEKMRELFEARMHAVCEIAEHKRQHGLPIRDPQREEELIQKNGASLLDPSLLPYYERFLEDTMRLSRAYQGKLFEDGAKGARAGVKALHLSLGTAEYDVLFDRGGLCRAGEYMDLNRRVLILTDDGVPREYADAVLAQCAEGYLYTVPQGEGSKTLERFSDIIDRMLAWRFTRGDAVVAVGGGVVGDLAGFVASAFMRGVDFYNIPTTVLAQVDSSVGGKTGVNFRHIKNTVGAFYQPRCVLIDTELLKTLPQRQIANGLCEAVKMALTSDEELFRFFEENEITEENMEEVIYRAVRIKAKIVSLDEREGGLRRILNLGHTLGHAIEAVEHDLFHGECVAIGMLPMCDEKLRPRVLTVLEKLSLPTLPPTSVDRYLPFAEFDKKREGDELSLVKVDTIGKGRIERVPIEKWKTLITRTFM